MTSIDDLANEIARAIQDYTEDVADAIAAAADKTAEDIRTDAESAAPKRKGEYASGFKVTKQSSRDAVRRIVWNKKHYRIVHLLEFGHAKRGGGRVRAYPHLRPAYDRNVDAFQEKVRRIVQNGGSP